MDDRRNKVLGERYKFILFVWFMAAIFSQSTRADIIYNAEITNLIVQAGSSNVVAVSMSNTDGKCQNNKVKFDKNDKELYSFILALYMAGKNVSFYFDPNGTSLAGISGHLVGTCELTNIWAAGT